MSNSFLKGAFIITVGAVLSKIIGGIYRIPLQNIAGDEVLGIFSLVYPVYMSVLIITVAGIPLAISQLIARAKEQGRVDDIHQIFITASMLASCFGVISFLFMFIFAEKIAFLLGGRFALYSLLVVSFTLLIAPYMSVYRGLFQGFGNMKPTAISQVIEQLVRVLLIIVAALLLTSWHWSSELVGAGVMVGSFFGAIASLLYLRHVYRKTPLKNKKNTLTYSLFKQWAKRILIISIPICVGAVTMALLNMVDSITIPPILRVVEDGYSEEGIMYAYGIYGRGIAVVQLAVMFASALILPLIPRVTAEFTKGNDQNMRRLLENVFKLTHFITWPIVIALVVLVLPLNIGLFTNMEGSGLIAILVFSSLFTSFAIVTTGILQGLNRAKQAAIVVLVSAVVKVVLNLLLVMAYGLHGAALATLFTYVLLLCLNLILIYRIVPFTIIRRDYVVFALASVVMGIVIGTPLLFFVVDAWSRIEALAYIAVMFVIGSIVYALVVLLGKGVTKEEMSHVFESRGSRFFSFFISGR